MKNIFKLTTVFLMLALSAFAQATKTYTTSAMTIDQTFIVVASGTGYTTGSVLYIWDAAGKEAVTVTGAAISTGRYPIRRGTNGTGRSTHASGTVVWLVQTGGYQTDPAGSCTSALSPRVIIRTESVFLCNSSSVWQKDGTQYGPLTTTVTTDSTAGPLTVTAAMMHGGLILRDPNGAGRTDTTSTAALLLAAMPGAKVGDSFEFTIRNTADAAETITVASGSTTGSGTLTIAQNNSKRFRVVWTNVTDTPAYSLYSLGTVVH